MKGWNGLLYFLLSLSCALIYLNSTKVLFPYILLTMQWVHTNIKLYTNIYILPISTWIGHLTKHWRYSICLCKIHTWYLHSFLYSLCYSYDVLHKTWLPFIQVGSLHMKRLGRNLNVYRATSKIPLLQNMRALITDYQRTQTCSTKIERKEENIKVHGKIIIKWKYPVIPHNKHAKKQQTENYKQQRQQTLWIKWNLRMEQIRDFINYSATLECLRLSTAVLRLK